MRGESSPFGFRSRSALLERAARRPQIAEGPIGTTGDTAISDLEITDRFPTSAAVSFTTDKCVYGDYRILVMDDPAQVTEFNAPRDGRCYTEHGITLGVDTPPLTPASGYTVTVVVTDPVTGEVNWAHQFFSSHLAEVTGSIVTSTVQGSSLILEGWAVDTTRAPGEAVRVHAFVNGRWRPGRLASLPTGDDYFGGVRTYTADYGPNLRFRMPVTIPSTGNHLVCLKGVDADAGLTAQGGPVFVDLGCRAIVREQNRPVGEITEMRRAGRDRVVLTGVAFEPAHLTDGGQLTRVVVRVDGRAVRRAVAGRSTGNIGALQQSCLGCAAGFRVALNLPAGAQRVCVSALNPDGVNQHLGCRRL